MCFRQCLLGGLLAMDSLQSPVCIFSSPLSQAGNIFQLPDYAGDRGECCVKHIFER